MKIYNLLLTLILPAVSILFLSCADQPTGPSDDIDMNPTAGYTITITDNPSAQKPDTLSLSTGNVTGWNPDLALLYLGPEDAEFNLARLEISLATPINVGVRYTGVRSALLSLTDVRVGTAEQINARLYTTDGVGEENLLGFITLANDSAIRGEAIILMRCISSYTCGSEVIGVKAEFTALDENR